MDAEIKLDEFIKQRRSTGASDGLILDELVNAGWDKNFVFNRLSGKKESMPPMAPSIPVSPSALSQNDLQVVSAEGDSTQTRMGLLSFFFSGSTLALAYTISGILFIFIAKIFNFYTENSNSYTVYRYAYLKDGSFKNTLILYIALCVPLTIIFIYCYKKLNRVISENPNLADDVYFRKNIRSTLTIALLGVVAYLFLLSYDFLNLIAGDKPFEKLSFWSSLLDLLAAGGASIILWKFSKKSSR